MQLSTYYKVQHGSEYVYKTFFKTRHESDMRQLGMTK